MNSRIFPRKSTSTYPERLNGCNIDPGFLFIFFRSICFIAQFRHTKKIGENHTKNHHASRLISETTKWFSKFDKNCCFFFFFSIAIVIAIGAVFFSPLFFLHVFENDLQYLQHCNCKKIFSNICLSPISAKQTASIVKEQRRNEKKCNGKRENKKQPAKKRMFATNDL